MAHRSPWRIASETAGPCSLRQPSRRPRLRSKIKTAHHVSKIKTAQAEIKQGYSKIEQEASKIEQGDRQSEQGDCKIEQ